MANKTDREVPTQTGVLLGVESTHGTEASSFDLVAGSSVIFAEAISDNKAESYDHADGQAMKELTKGAKDVGGSMNFRLVDWRWLYWAMGTDAMNELYLASPSGDFTAGSTVTGDSSGETATVDSYDNSTNILTVSSISGTFEHGEGLTESVNGTETATLGAFVHDLSFANIPDSFSICQVFETPAKNQKYLGNRVNTATLTSSRGEMIVVDIDWTGLSEATPDSAETRLATSKTPWIWSTGDVVINDDTYTDICENISLQIFRNAVAKGGHDDEEANKVVMGTRKIEITVDMDFADFDIRTLRKNNTKFTMTLTFTNTANDDECTITLSNCQLDSDPIEIGRDAETVTYSTLSKTGSMTARVFDDIFDMATA